MVKKQKKIQSQRNAAVVQEKKYYPFLDGFRGFAIVMILVHHMRRGFTLDYLFVSDPPILKWIYIKSYETFGINLTWFYKTIQVFISQLKGVLGVEIFFVISGFLITGILLRSDLTKEAVLRFYQRRFLRIYPCYFIMVIISLFVYAIQSHNNIIDILRSAITHLFFLQNYFGANSLLAHTWTLVILEQFYFFCPLVMMFVFLIAPKTPIRRWYLIGVCLLIMCITPFIRMFFLTTGQPVISWPVKSPTPYWTTIYNLGPLCFGCLLALFEPYWSSWKQSKWWGAILWCSGVSLFIWLFAQDWSYYWGKWYFYRLGYVSIGLLFFAAYHGFSLIVRLKFFQWIGKHSYGIFVWHYLVLEFWKLGCGTLAPEFLMIGFLATSIGVGVLSTNTLERYFLSLRDKLILKL